MPSAKYDKSIRDRWKRFRKVRPDISDISEMLKMEEKKEQIRMKSSKRGLRDTLSSIKGV